MRRPLLTVLLAATALASPVHAQTPPAAPVPAVAPAGEADFQRAADAVLGLVQAAEAQPGAAPAFSVVMVRRGQPPLIWTHGRLSADPASPAAGDDTPSTSPPRPRPSSVYWRSSSTPRASSTWTRPSPTSGPI